jgi:putative ABC transport system permease protein
MERRRSRFILLQAAVKNTLNGAVVCIVIKAIGHLRVESLPAKRCLLETLLQDMRYGLRMLLKSPGFTTLAVVALALGIGANTAVYSVAIAFLRKPVSFPQSDRIVLPLLGGDQISPADYLDWKAQSHSFEEFAAVRIDGVNMTGNGDPEAVDMGDVSANFFATLGVMPVLGRPFSPQEEQPGSEHEVILSYGLWQRRFGADPNILGKTVELNAATYDIVGVMGKGFNFPGAENMWRPLALTPEDRTDRNRRFVIPIARLKPGVSIGEATAEMRTVEGQIQKQFPKTETGWTVRVLPISIYVTGDLTDRYCRMLIGAVLFVMLIACANVANLLFARAVSRQKEIAVRRAMGASRVRIVRQLLTESLLLAFGGACLGLLLGEWGMSLLRYYMPPEVEKFLPMWQHVRLEADVFWYTVAVALVAGVIAGLAPAFQSSKSDINEELKEGGRGNTGGQARQRLRSVFVVAEVALSLVLLVGAGLMVKSVRSMLVVNPNVDAKHVLTMDVGVPPSKYKTPAQIRQFFDQALQRLAAIPGVHAAALTITVPMGYFEVDDAISVQARAFHPGDDPEANIEIVSPGYFQVMNIPLRQGRLLSETDGPDQAPVVVISQSFAQHYFPNQDPIGKFIRRGEADSKSPWAKIVGVVGDIRYDVVGLGETPPVYFPYQQSARGFYYLTIKTDSDPLSFAAAVRSQIEKVDPDVPIQDAMTLQKLITNQLIWFSYVAAMLAVLGIMALVLASVGVYGVMAYSVSERSHEIGVRMALGAQPGDVLRLMMMRGLAMTLIGVAIGLPASWALARVLAGLFFGVSATDLATFSGITAMMCAVTLLACFVPAHRATRVDPMVALRHE